MTPSEIRRRGCPDIQILLLTAVLIGAFITVYFPVWKNLVNTWMTSDDYSHGFFIVPASIYLVWQKREFLSKIPVQPSIYGIFLIVFSLLIYVFAYFAGIQTVASFSIIPVLIGIVAYLHGFLILKNLLFPLLFLLFMIPIPSQIYSSLTIPLQLTVSKFSVYISGVMGIPVYREGNIIYLPELTLQVVNACSGLRSLISLFAISTFYGYLSFKSNILRTILIVFSIPIAILVNTARIAIIIIAFHFFKSDLTAEQYHTVFGLMVFFLALFILVLVKGLLSFWEPSAPQE